MSDKVPIVSEPSLDNLTEALLAPDYEGEEQIFKAIDKFYENIETRTDIAPAKIIQIIKVQFYAEMLKEFLKFGDIDLKKVYEKLDIVLEHYFKLRVSNSRKGRSEFFSTLFGMGSTGQKLSLGERLIGRRRY